MKAGGVRAGAEKYFSSVKQLCVEKLLDNTIGWPLVQGLRNDDKAVPDAAGPGQCVMQPLHKDAIRATPPGNCGCNSTPLLTGDWKVARTRGQECSRYVAAFQSPVSTNPGLPVQERCLDAPVLL